MKTKKLLIVALILGAVLRLIFLATNPPHLTPDEAALGYNAYSILKTGRDEYGKLFPIIFKSFGDFKPGLYIYLAAPLVGIFGLNEFSVRLPSAIAGVISIYLIYLVTKKLFPKRKYVSVVSAFLFAINPWNIHFSRGAWEINVSLALTLAGIYFFIKSFDKAKYLIYSAAFFGLTLLTYQGAKLSSLIVLVLLVITYWKDVKKLILKKRGVFYKSFSVGLLISLPIILSLFQGKTGRLTVFSVFSYPRSRDYTQAFLDQGNEKIGSLSYYLFHSETLNFKRGVLGRWFNHLSDRFLFFDGDWQNPRHSPPYHGMFLVLDILLVISGFVALAKLTDNKAASNKAKFVLVWAAVASLPAIFSRGQVHAVRSYNMLVPLIIMNAFGLVLFYNFLRKNGYIKKFIISLFALAYLGSFVYYLDSYFVHLPEKDSKHWQYGYKEVVETITPIQDEYETIKVQQSFDQPYIYFLFYQEYSPAEYQEQAKLTEVLEDDVGQVQKLDNVEFAPIDWSINRGESGTLFVADPIRIPPEDSAEGDEFKLIKEIRYLDGETAFRIIEVL